MRVFFQESFTTTHEATLPNSFTCYSVVTRNAFLFRSIAFRLVTRKLVVTEFDIMQKIKLVFNLLRFGAKWGIRR